MCDIVIIGGGVSGIVSAIKSFNGRNRITILERNDKCLKKLLLTGNGRCNYFNDDTSISNYHSMREDLLDKEYMMEYGGITYDFSDKNYVLYAHILSSRETMHNLMNGISTSKTNFMFFGYHSSMFYGKIL